jgi:hypothetical protein
MSATPPSCDERFVEGLKRLPGRDRGWEDPPGRWWIAPKHRAAVCALAAKYYPLASLYEGATVTNLRTGQVIEQLDLFEGG